MHTYTKQTIGACKADHAHTKTEFAPTTEHAHKKPIMRLSRPRPGNLVGAANNRTASLSWAAVVYEQRVPSLLSLLFARACTFSILVHTYLPTTR